MDREQRLLQVCEALTDYETTRPEDCANLLSYVLIVNARFFRLEALVTNYEYDFKEPIREAVSDLIKLWRDS